MQDETCRECGNFKNDGECLAACAEEHDETYEIGGEG